MGFEPAAGVSFVLAYLVADLGVDVIEAGFPAASRGDWESVNAVAREVQGPIICGLARCNRGDIELVDVSTDGVVQIRFHGACHGCPSSTMTLQMGIERNLREKVPEITSVVPVA